MRSIHRPLIPLLRLISLATYSRLLLRYCLL